MDAHQCHATAMMCVRMHAHAARSCTQHGQSVACIGPNGQHRRVDICAHAWTHQSSPSGVITMTILLLASQLTCVRWGAGVGAGTQEAFKLFHGRAPMNCEL